MATTFVLWGYHPRVLPEPYPIRLTGGNVGHCRGEQRERVAQGWTCGIYRQGDRPVGLRLQVAQAQNHCATCGEPCSGTRCGPCQDEHIYDDPNA